MKRQEATKECLQKLLVAIVNMRVSIVDFFMRAAQALQVKRTQAEREAEKFKRVKADGLHRHRGYKVPFWVLTFAEQTQAATAAA